MKTSTYNPHTEKTPLNGICLPKDGNPIAILKSPDDAPKAILVFSVGDLLHRWTDDCGAPGRHRSIAVIQLHPD